MMGIGSSSLKPDVGVSRCNALKHPPRPGAAPECKNDNRASSCLRNRKQGTERKHDDNQEGMIMTMRNKVMKEYHKAMGHTNKNGHPIIWGALGLGAWYLLRKRGHHKIEVE